MSDRDTNPDLAGWVTNLGQGLDRNPWDEISAPGDTALPLAATADYPPLELAAQPQSSAARAIGEFSVWLAACHDQDELEALKLACQTEVFSSPDDTIKRRLAEAALRLVEVRIRSLTAGVYTSQHAADTAETGTDDGVPREFARYRAWGGANQGVSEEKPSDEVEVITDPGQVAAAIAELEQRTAEYAQMINAEYERAARAGRHVNSDLVTSLQTQIGDVARLVNDIHRTGTVIRDRPYADVEQLERVLKGLRRYLDNP